jgi:hypothetical protein
LELELKAGRFETTDLLAASTTAAPAAAVVTHHRATAP